MTPEEEARTLWWFHLVFGGAFIGAAVAIVKSGRVTLDLSGLALSPGDGDGDWMEVPFDKWSCFLVRRSTKDEHARLAEGCFVLGDGAERKLVCERETYLRRMRICKSMGLGSVRSARWQAARVRSQRIQQTHHKPSQWDSWTDEELRQKVLDLMFGPPGYHVENRGVWGDLDSIWSKAVSADPKKYCAWYARALPDTIMRARRVKEIWDTGRLRHFAKSYGPPGTPYVDVNMISDRIKEVVDAVEKACGRYDGPLL